VSGAEGVWAVIPVKPLRGALRRLTSALEAPVRRELQVAMLTDVLGACAGARELAGVMVVTSDPDAGAMERAITRAEGVDDQRPPRGMNAAVARGLAAVAAERADAALVLTADLPLALPEDLAAIVAAGPPGPSALLVPSADGTGTNAMLLRPPGALAPRLGPDSCARHEAQAARRALPSARLELPRLALDIDTPADLTALVARGAACATLAVCERLRITERLEAGSVL
jgi:2-phospho-L-lactate/phosphoenolpyruvate guanylyltransferase